MRKILLCGCNGRMGQTISRLAGGRDDVAVSAGCDVAGKSAFDYPVYGSPAECEGRPDVLLDFSGPAALDGILTFCGERSVPLVLCSTGHDAAQLAKLELAAQIIPVFRSGNMSLGIYLLMELAKTAAGVLGKEFDIEVLERHHRLKVDAPSGTALMLYDAVSASLPYQPEPIYDRQPVRKARGDREIGLHAVRGGTIVGEHEVIFAGHDEIITLSHSARSREVFAVGALRAAVFMAGAKKPGLYDMRDIIHENN
jgi:4-hydroxy-tetrahydrodipicolinate reductase